MMPKTAKRSSDGMLLQTMRIDHVYDLGSIRSKITVIWRKNEKGRSFRTGRPIIPPVVRSFCREAMMRTAVLCLALLTFLAALLYIH